jgi:hypothetical protein
MTRKTPNPRVKGHLKRYDVIDVEPHERRVTPELETVVPNTQLQTMRFFTMNGYPDLAYIQSYEDILSDLQHRDR